MSSKIISKTSNRPKYLQYGDKVFKVFIKNQEIKDAVWKVAQDIFKKYKDYKVPPIFVVILNGGVKFSQLLSKYLTDLGADWIFTYMRVGSYESTESTGKVKLLQDLVEDVSGKNVVIIEDIIDTGNSMKFIHSYLEKRDPKKIETAVLCFKPEKYKKHGELAGAIDYICLTIDDAFIIGWGFDLDSKARGYRDIYQYDPTLTNTILEK